MDGDLDRPIITGVVPGTGDGLNKSMVTSANSTVNKIKTPGNIVIEMQDGKGSGPKDNASDTTSEQQNTRVKDAARVSTVKPPPGQAHQSHFYDVPAIRGVKPLLTEQQNTAGDADELSDGDASISEQETADDKWLKLSVYNYDGDTNDTNSSLEPMSVVRLGKQSSENDDHGKGLLLRTSDAIYTDSKGILVETKGVNWSYSHDMKGSFTAGYTSDLSTVLSSAVKIGGSLSATIAYDVSVSAAAKVSYSFGASHTVDRGYKFEEVGHAKVTNSKVIIMTAREPGSYKWVSAAKPANKFAANKDANSWNALENTSKFALASVGAGALINAGTYIGSMGHAGADVKDQAENCLYANMASTIATMAAAGIYANQKRKMMDIEKKYIKDSAIFTMENDSIVLSCDGSSIVINGDGVFINGKSFRVGKLPEDKETFSPYDPNPTNTAEADSEVALKGVVVSKLVPETISIHAQNDISMLSNAENPDTVGTAADKEKGSWFELTAEKATLAGKDINITADQKGTKLESYIQLGAAATLSSKDAITVNSRTAKATFCGVSTEIGKGATLGTHNTTLTLKG
jgi:hypothetical protein